MIQIIRYAISSLRGSGWGRRRKQPGRNPNSPSDSPKKAIRGLPLQAATGYQRIVHKLAWGPSQIGAIPTPLLMYTGIIRYAWSRPTPAAHSIRPNCERRAMVAPAKRATRSYREHRMGQYAKEKLGRRVATVVTCLLLFLHPDQSEAQDALSIKGFPPERPIEIVGNSWFIFLDGVIDSEAPKRFEQYITQNHIPDRSIVYLNSPGGSLIAGLELGRLFRKYGLSTDVGRKSPTSNRRFDIAAGECYSACSYAYLGGQFRYLTEGSHYGVHQFRSTGQEPASEGDTQTASAAIVEYVRSMDVDPELFGLSVSAGPNGMFEIDKPTLERLNVVNNGRTRPIWSIQSAAGKLYLKGERITEESGINKFIIYCDNRKTMLLAIFDTLRRDSELMEMSAHSLLIDDQVYPINAVSKQIQNGLFNVEYKLSTREISALRRAENVGVSIRFSYQAPVFFGFQGMRVGDGRQKLIGTLNQCAHDR